MSFKQCKINCTNTGKSQTADILNRTDKSLKVSPVGTTLVINLTRSDLRKPYVGNLAKLEFTCDGNEL